MSLGPGKTAAQAIHNPGDGGGPMSIDPEGTDVRAAGTPSDRGARHRCPTPELAPCDGVRVLDFTQVMMGPCCAGRLRRRRDDRTGRGR